MYFSANRGQNRFERRCNDMQCNAHATRSLHPLSVVSSSKNPLSQDEA